MEWILKLKGLVSGGQYTYRTEDGETVVGDNAYERAQKFASQMDAEEFRLSLPDGDRWEVFPPNTPPPEAV